MLVVKSGGGNLKRQSNFELLRIVAMFLVLIVHADFFSLGRPSQEAMSGHPFSSMMRYVVESLALVCVNVYIIISGYFGIKLKTKSIFNFVFLVVFWRVLINLLFLAASWSGLMTVEISVKKLFLLCVPGYDDWFVSSYILLLFFAQFLNAYIEKSTARRLWVFVFAYEGFQILFSWVYPVYSVFTAGYSFLSLAGLYMLGAAIRKTGKDIVRRPLTLYFALSVAVGVAVYLCGRCDLLSPIFPRMLAWFEAYNGLTILLASTFLFLGFRRLSFTNRAVNYIAASSFAVYLMHMHPLMRCRFSYVCRYLFENFGTFQYIVLISLFIISVFAVAVLVDLGRRALWDKISGSAFFGRLSDRCDALTRG